MQVLSCFVNFSDIAPPTGDTLSFHLFLVNGRNFLGLLFRVGVKCISAGLTRFLNCFLVLRPVRVQFRSFEFVVCSLFSADLLFTLTSYPWLAKS